MTTSIGSKILQKASGELRKLGQLGRQDLAIVDFQGIDDGKRVGRVLLTYAHNMETPCARDVQTFFLENFGNSVQANLATLRVHPDDFALSVVANVLVQVRPITDATDLTRVNPLVYLDANTHEVWDVVSDDLNRKHLIRRSDENLSEVIEARKVRQMRSAPKLAELKEGAVACQVGDHITFYDNGVIAHGEVTQCQGHTVTVKTVSGVTTVDRLAVFQVTQKSPEAMSNEKDVLRQYFEKAYGDPDFAAKLTNETAPEAAGGKTGY